MEIPETILEQIKDTCKDIDFGRVTIEINSTANHIDVIAEKRIRMQRQPTKNTGTPIKTNRKPIRVL